MMRRALAWTVVAVAWAALWCALPVAALHAIAGEAAPGSQVAHSAADFLEMVARLPEMVTAGVFGPWQLVLAGVLAVPASAFMIALAYAVLDRQRISVGALRWLLSALPWALAAIVPVVIALALDSWTALIIAVAATLPLAFLLRGDVVAALPPPSAWVPQWPGIAPVALASVAWAAWTLSSMIDSFITAHGPATAVAAYWIADWLLWLAIAPPLYVAWLGRHRWASIRARARRWCRWSTLRPLAALDLRIAWCIVFVIAPPVLAVFCWNIYISPQFQHSQEADGTPGAGWSVYPGLFEHFWLASIPLCWAYALAQARVVHVAMHDAGIGEPADV